MRPRASLSGRIRAGSSDTLTPPAIWPSLGAAPPRPWHSQDSRLPAEAPGLVTISAFENAGGKPQQKSKKAPPHLPRPPGRKEVCVTSLSSVQGGGPRHRCNPSPGSPRQNRGQDATGQGPLPAKWAAPPQNKEQEEREGEAPAPRPVCRGDAENMEQPNRVTSDTLQGLRRCGSP